MEDWWAPLSLNPIKFWRRCTSRNLVLGFSFWVKCSFSCSTSAAHSNKPMWRAKHVTQCQCFLVLPLPACLWFYWISLRLFYCFTEKDILLQKEKTTLPVLLTSGRKRRNTGRAYGGSAFSISFTNLSRSVAWDGSAMAAIPAFPSAPVQTENHCTNV